MNERKEEKRVTSIARKINLQNVGSMLLAYLWVDILVCIVLAAVMIYGLDVQLAGRFDITYARKLMIETSVWDMVYQVGHKGSSVYYLVEIGPWLIWFMIGGCVVLVWELVEIIKKLMRGKMHALGADLTSDSNEWGTITVGICNTGDQVGCART